jgi:ABC-type sugar transport system ATPase subunit
MIPALSFHHITKRFPGVLALEDVSFSIAAGTCHALCGENGAGKSTLGKILAGIYRPDAGHVDVSGARADFSGPQQALAAGIGIVHQELAFCDNLSVAENLCLGALPARHTFVSRDEMARQAREMLAATGADIDVHQIVRELTIGQQQVVQIAAAIGRGARIIVFDEPTSSLSQHEADRLYDLIVRLREQGVTAIYVSHRMDEIFRLCDAVTVLRDGRHVATQPIASLDRAALVELMIGRRLEEYFPAHVQAAPGPELLRVEGLTSPAGFRDISFSVRGGEVLGLAGLVGAGRSEIAQAIFGLDPHTTGRIFVQGQQVRISNPEQAMGHRIGLVPEDRKRQGLVLSMSAGSNTTLATLAWLSRLGFIKRRAERAQADTYFSRLRVRASSPDVLSAGLSGGNQQKLVLAKWLAARCRILILDEPTRGVDVGAKAEIHALIDQLAADGNAVILISSELPEVLHLSTRILVLREGRVAGELSREAANQAAVMRLMAGLGE